jgi:hypothetical protein
LTQKAVMAQALYLLKVKDTCQQLIANDPANSINQYEFYPMKAISKQS